MRTCCRLCCRCARYFRVSSLLVCLYPIDTKDQALVDEDLLPPLLPVRRALTVFKLNGMKHNVTINMSSAYNRVSSANHIAFAMPSWRDVVPYVISSDNTC